MIIFGKKEIISTPEQLTAVFSKAKAKVPAMSDTPIENILQTLDAVGSLWKPNQKYYLLAQEYLSREITFHPKMIEMTLDLIPALLNYSALKIRLQSELGSTDILDSYQTLPYFDGKIKAFARGIVTHISAGNIFLGCIDSLILGFITKNINLLKLSSKNQSFPLLFAESIIEADNSNILTPYFSMLHWQGGNSKFEDIVKNHSDTIMAWGGEEMVKTYKNNLSLTCKLLDFGPKISIQIITKDGVAGSDIKIVGELIATEVALWDQSACASAQNLFFEAGVDIKSVMDAVKIALEKQIPRGKVSGDEEVEILKEKARGLYDCAQGAYEIIGCDFYLRQDLNPTLSTSPLNRTLMFKEFTSINELTNMLGSFSFFLQSASILSNAKEERTLKQLLPLKGVKRIAPLGSMLEGMNGAPHDGRYITRELLNFIPFESRGNFLNFINDVAMSVPFYKESTNLPVKKIEDLPITDSSTYKKYPPHKSKYLLNANSPHGQFFSSGGTTGEPKFVFYTHEEFETIGKMLAFGLKLQGLKENERVANLFAAGNMWSSFMAIDIALRINGANVLPIGGLCPVEDIINYLQLFEVKTVMGLPSLMVEYAKFCEEKNIKLQIDQIFFAGEHLHKSAKTYLEKIWNVKKFSSAGYASVDAGLIGYQTPDCAYGEHYLFSKYVHLEIINHEAVVTSLFRKSMPVLRYKTGDEIELLDVVNEFGDRKFKLKGRLDDQINLWSCKVNGRELEIAIDQLPFEIINFQIKITENIKGQDHLIIAIETNNKTIENTIIANSIHKYSHDINQTITCEFVQNNIEVNILNNSSIKHVQRTGKLKNIIDIRS